MLHEGGDFTAFYILIWVLGVGTCTVKPTLWTCTVKHTLRTCTVKPTQWSCTIKPALGTLR